MRVLGNIPHPSITITVFGMNDKYIIKLEAGPMEQVFKISQEEIGGMESIQKLLDQEFLDKALKRFNEMFSEFQNAKAKNIL